MDRDTRADVDALFTRVLPPGASLAVVGLSPHPQRESHRVARAMQGRGFQLIPVNPNATEVLGESAYPTLTAAAQHHRIAAINVFRRSAEVPALVDEAVALGATGLWLQVGVRHDEAAARARAAGLVVVQDRCIQVVHRGWRTPPE